MNQADRQIVLSLPLSMVGVVIQALGEMPAKFSIHAISSIQEQVDTQMRELPAPPAGDNTGT